MRAGQWVALFIGLLFVLAGLHAGFRPLGHNTGTTGTLYCANSPLGESSVVPIGGGDCPDNTYALNASSGVHVAERNCGSAFLPAAYDSGATRPGARMIPAGITEQWEILPSCGPLIASGRDAGGALIVIGTLVALAGFFIFQTRKRPATVS